jgi:NTE family protein
MLLMSIQTMHAQRVAVVLSGGGADGLAHIGMLKVLEKQGIPVDYVVGTSMGALVGALYAAGYSPEEIEERIKSEAFKRWSNGEAETPYVYHFKKNPGDASWISFRFSPDTLILSSLPTNVVSPVPLDFGLLEYFGPASAAAGYVFDSLMIPFRCVASNITAKCEAIMGSGDLGQAVRASMSYPFFIKPLNIDGNLYVDGGLYNNYPVDVAAEYFQPDLIIGCNVSENLKAPNEDDLLSQIKSMLVNRDPLKSTPVNMITIKPVTGIVGLFDFNDPEPVIAAGEAATLERMPEILAKVERRISADEWKIRRNAFRFKIKQIKVNEFNIKGLNKYQRKYVERLFINHEEEIGLDNIKEQYFRLEADPKFAQLYPLLSQKEDSTFRLDLYVKKDKSLQASAGGNFSSRPINAAFVGLQYHYLRRTGITLSANTYFGRLYGSYQIRARFDFPLRFPFYTELSFTRNRFDFFRSSTAFFEESRPSFLVRNDNSLDLHFGIPVWNKGKFTLGSNIARLDNRYYQTKIFTQRDTTDRTLFLMNSTYICYERNTLNRKQYASSGTNLVLKARYVLGNEITDPGTTADDTLFYTAFHQWPILQASYENYFINKGIWRAGFLTEVVWSKLPFFFNYTATALISPAFFPIPEARTFFLEDFRAGTFAGFGFRNIFSVFKDKLDLRLEGYLFQPYQALRRDELQKPIYGKPFESRRYVLSSSLVWHSPLGPMSMSFNYYEKKEVPYSILFSFGYLLFNKQALE